MNPDTALPSSHEPWLVLLSFAIAVTASFVALELAGRVRAPSRVISLGWLSGGSLAMGTGIWAMHFIGLLAYELPVGVGYRPGPIVWSWLAAVVVSALALQVARQPRLMPATLLTAACAMAAGICGMHYIGMLSLDFAPGVQWRRVWVGASVLVALGASAVALLLFFHVRALPAPQRRRQQAGASVVMAGAICGMHYLGMAAMAVPAGAVCLSANQLHGEGLAMLVGFAALLLLALTLGTAMLDERLQARASHLTRSLGQAQDNLRHAELHDALTGLPNRQQFDERLAALQPEAEAAEQVPAPLPLVAALLFLDLDGLKPVNEAYGHEAGDVVLCQVAERLRAQSRNTDLVARLGSDEFVVLLTGIGDAQAVRQVADRVLSLLRQPVPLGSGSARITGSIGIALMPQDGSGDRLLLAAKTAMSAAKVAGGGQAVFFAPRMETEAREALLLQNDLRRAIETPASGELMLHYQPKVRAADGCVCGVEALLRWRHPQRGMVSPVQFIPVAERSGLIVALGAWVIDEACRQLAEWRDRGLRLEVAVNLSMHQLRQGGLVEHVRAALQRHGLVAGQLMFEITESAAMSDTDATLRAFDELAGLGTKLAIDDFGTGYSSLVWLRKLPSRQLKIDRSFVMDLDSCNDAHAIVQAVVQLAHALGLEVVAEGVETPGQRDLLRALHCDQLQGYLFARPVPGEQLMRWAMGIDRPVQLQFDGDALGALPAAAL